MANMALSAEQLQLIYLIYTQCANYWIIMASKQTQLKAFKGFRTEIGNKFGFEGGSWAACFFYRDAIIIPE